MIISLTRSNSNHDIGFMQSAERVNVMLSRARDALIMIGNVETFHHARKGVETWRPLLDNLRKGGHIYDGFPVKCERHLTKIGLLVRCLGYIMNLSLLTILIEEISRRF